MSSDALQWRDSLRVSRPRFWLYLFGPFLLGVAAVLRSELVHLPFAERSQMLLNVGRFLAQMAADAPVVFWQGFQQDPHRTLVTLVWVAGILFCLLALFSYWLFPANLLIYGVNDLFDLETDRLNPKKDAYELRLSPLKQRHLLREIIWTNVLWFTACAFLPIANALLIPDPWIGTWRFIPSVLSLIGFLFLGVFYSAPPIRAKARPFLDMAFNILYVMPGLFSYFFFSAIFLYQERFLSLSFPWLVFLAASLWCMAMHAYSAVPDIKADLGANLSTVATRLGARRTLWLCLSLYTGSTVFALLAASGQVLRLVYIVLGAVYIGLMLASLRRADHIFPVYRYFPLVNTLSGMVLFFSLLLF